MALPSFAAGIINFEDATGFGLSDDSIVTTQYRSSVGVTFHFEVLSNPTQNGARLEALGTDGAGGTDAFFTCCDATYGNDFAISGNLGNYFLRGGNDFGFTQPGTLIVTYDDAVAGASGDIFDIDAPSDTWTGGDWAQNRERWLVTAYDAVNGGSIVYQQYSPYGDAENRASSLNGKPWQFYVGNPTGPNNIHRIEISYAGDNRAANGLGIGIGFDNFYYDVNNPPVDNPVCSPVLGMSDGTNMGRVLVGRTSSSEIVRVSNSGDGCTVSGNVIATTGGDFINTGGTFDLLAGDSADVSTVNFTPTERGSFSHEIIASSNVGTEIRTFNGVGVAAQSDLGEGQIGAVLVGHTQSVSADFQVSNVGDGNTSGEDASLSNLNAEDAAGGGGSLVGVSLGDTESTTVTHGFQVSATQKGAPVTGTTLLGRFANGSSDGRNNDHDAIADYVGYGVAPVADVAGGDAGRFLVGYEQTNTAEANIQNTGDGNTSGVDEAISNLNGESGAVASVSLNDNAATQVDVDVTFTASQRGEVVSRDVSLGFFANGSADGANQRNEAIATFTGLGVAAESDITGGDAGFFLVGSEQTNTAQATVTNIGDGNSSGVDASISNLRGESGAVAGISLADGDSDNVDVDVTFTAGVRGEALTRDITFGRLANGSQDGRNLAHDVTGTFTGTAVAPQAKVELLGNPGVGFVLVGDDRVGNVTITNEGDGNLSGMGEVSNLRGTVNGQDISLIDGSSETIQAGATATYQGEVVTADIDIDLVNGNPDGSNTQYSDTISYSAIGVAPVMLVIPELIIDDPRVQTTFEEIGEIDLGGQVNVGVERGRAVRIRFNVLNVGDGNLVVDTDDDGNADVDWNNDGDLDDHDFAAANSNLEYAVDQVAFAGGRRDRTWSSRAEVGNLRDFGEDSFIVDFRPRSDGTFSATVEFEALNGDPFGTNGRYVTNMQLNGFIVAGGSTGIGGLLDFGFFGASDGGTVTCSFGLTILDDAQDVDCVSGAGTSDDPFAFSGNDDLLSAGGLDDPLVLNVFGYRFEGEDGHLFDINFSAGVLTEGVNALTQGISLDIDAAIADLASRGITEGEYDLDASIFFDTDNGEYFFDLGGTLALGGTDDGGSGGTSVPVPAGAALILPAAFVLLRRRGIE